MVFPNIHRQAWTVYITMLVLFSSCATYNQKMEKYYGQLEKKQYDNALKTLDNTKFIRQDRNKLLYYFEKGKVYHLMQHYDSSNTYLNLADKFIEDERKKATDVVKGLLLNPMVKTYLGEDMERFMMHYYKALNYSYLNLGTDAVVEARRITLAENAQGDKFNNNTNRYSKDAFALNVQGMVYEAAGDVNNAFISYRNAVDVYLASGNLYYGVPMPNQLKQDLLRTANQMGFYDQQQLYETKLNTTYKKEDAEGGYLVYFVERGLAPIKKERNFFVTSNSNGVAGFYYVDESGNSINIPFDWGYYHFDRDPNYQSASLQSFRSLRVAIPYYESRYSNNAPVNITVNNQTYTSETAQDVNTVAKDILKERMLKEVADAIARQVAKKLLEIASQKAAEAAAKSNSKEKDEKKKEEKAKNAGEITGLVMNLFNNFTEKADTRNWQSLPAYIQYVRIPLKKGENTVTIAGKTKTRTITVNGTGNLQFMSKAVW